VVETSLVLVNDMAGMSFQKGAETGQGDGARAAALVGGEAATRPPAVRSATSRLQRVRAFMRVTQRATGSTCGGRVWTACAVRLTPHGSRREPVTLLFDAGGPGPLTEDRQKPLGLQSADCELGRYVRLDGKHGTCNTVPSGAARPGSEPRGGGLEPTSNLSCLRDGETRAD
jgi:hypothetical protein